MTDERKETLLKTLFTDEASAKAALAMTPEEVQATLKEKGLDYTLDEINEVGAELKDCGEKLKAAIDENGGELTPELLEQVAGGMTTGAIVTLAVFGTLLTVLTAGYFAAAIASLFSW